MKKKQVFRAMSTMLSFVMCCSVITSFAGCKDEENSDSSGGSTSTKRDSIVIMTEELSGLFNPFYATSGTDMDVVGMTQIGMLSTDANGQPVAGDDEPTVVKDFKKETVNAGATDEKTVYTFVLKNGLKFSDGHPLTMNDVMFNMYEYLDPVYTGSSTMYSIDIEGLTTYRTQQQLSDDGETDQLVQHHGIGDERGNQPSKRYVRLHECSCDESGTGGHVGRRLSRNLVGRLRIDVEDV